MSQLMHAFNPMDFDPSQGGASWPLGKHPVVITAAEVKATKDQNNGRLVFKLKVIDGPNAGHEGDYGLNLYHQSQDAANIAHRQLSAVCHVTQTFQLGPDGTQLQYLFNKPFIIEVGMQKGQEAQEKGYTEIKRVYDINGNEPGKAGQVTQQGNAQPAQGFGGGQAQQGQQQAPAAQQGGAQAWGGQQNGQQASAPAQGGGWGTQAQQGQQGGSNAGGSWQQNQGQQQAPAWGQR